MMKTQYIKPEIQMVLSENMLMASNSWTVDKANNVNDPDGNDHGHIFGPDTDWVRILVGVVPQIHLTATTGNQKYM